jgi:hypothetical protein
LYFEDKYQQADFQSQIFLYDKRQLSAGLSATSAIILDLKTKNKRILQNIKNKRKTLDNFKNKTYYWRCA